jgi:DNA-binding PadR family transcriptional regulator
MDDARAYLPLTPQQFHILLALADEARHGYGIILEIAERSGGALRLGTGTLYTALARLVELEIIVESDGGAASRSGAGRRGPRAARPGGRGPRSELDARRRYYRLTLLGRAVLEAEAARLDALVKQARRKGIQPVRRPAVSRSR